MQNEGNVEGKVIVSCPLRKVVMQSNYVLVVHIE